MLNGAMYVSCPVLFRQHTTKSSPTPETSSFRPKRVSRKPRSPHNGVIAVPSSLPSLYSCKLSLASLFAKEGGFTAARSAPAGTCRRRRPARRRSG